MASVQILYWKDIPVQVRARDEKGRASLPMPDRFQVAIDQAAMLAGLTGSDAYTELYEWRNSDDRSGTALEVVAAVVAELDAQYADIDWRKTAAAVKND
jgi:hypothetical protein